MRNERGNPGDRGKGSRRGISDRHTIAMSGFPMVAVALALAAGAAALAWGSLGIGTYRDVAPLGLAGAAVLVVATLAFCHGFYVVQPNTSAVIVLFGRYVGTDSEDGFRWTNPFASVERVSRRTHSLETSVLKVNDGNGNPIEIAAAVMWYVDDAARAALQVESYGKFVKIQAEASVRALASSHPYDHHDDVEPGESDAPAPRTAPERVPSLLGGGDEISKILTAELSDRLEVAGVVVDEARITHLAYAPEIASAMLRRQQAQAIISAKRKIVAGAVDMTKDAIEQLKAKGVDIEEDRRASLVQNLLVVLVADREAAPVVNAGSVYS